jgi:hypothetical protein
VTGKREGILLKVEALMGQAPICGACNGEGGHFIRLSNPAVPDIVLQYTTFRQITDDISDARVYGGIHFRTDQDAGERLGKAIGKAEYKNNLRRMQRQVQATPMIVKAKVGSQGIQPRVSLQK